MDGLYSHEDYRREKRTLEDKLATLEVPGVDGAMKAGKLLERLPDLRENANLAEGRELLMATLHAVYADTVGGEVRGSHPLQAIFPANL